VTSKTGDLSGWAAGGQADVQGDIVRSGSHAAYIGTVDFDMDEKNDFTEASGGATIHGNSLFQEIDVAPGMTTLDIWYNVFTWDCSPWDDPAFEITIFGQMLTVSAGDIRSTCQPVALGNTGWQLSSHDISNHAGSVIWLTFYAGNGPEAGPLQSWAYIDDIVIHAPEPSQALLYACALVTLAVLRRRARYTNASPG